MTEISFRFNVADRLDYACRYLRKALRAGSTAVVAAPAPTLAQLDRALWCFDPLDFVPHALLRSGQAIVPRLAATPIWLVEEVLATTQRELLVNLGPEPPAGFEAFARVIEIVGTDDEDRRAARQRWRHYQSRGYKIESHAVGE